MYIAEIEDGVWLAFGNGDPCRTLVKDSARKFDMKSQAWRATEKAQAIPHRKGFPYALIEEIS